MKKAHNLLYILAAVLVVASFWNPWHLLFALAILGLRRAFVLEQMSSRHHAIYRGRLAGKYRYPKTSR